MSAPPPGVPVARYGDDSTGAAAVMEAPAFAGPPAALSLDAPTPARPTRFPGCRGAGVAGTARSRPPEWMDAPPPPPHAALARLGAPITRHKTRSTFDSAPHPGSIGRAIEPAPPVFGGAFVPLLTASPADGRHQAFGALSAAVHDTVHRLDRHPVMARHPATPMDEADLGRPLARPTGPPVGLVDLVATAPGGASRSAGGHRH